MTYLQTAQYRRTALLFTFPILLGVAALDADGAARRRAVSLPTGGEFVQQVRPLLQKYCVKCHDAKLRLGGVDFASLTEERAALRQTKLWRKTLAQLNAVAMPPTGEKQPTAAQHAALSGWVNRAVNASDPNDPASHDPGPALVRRLTLAEYDNTVRDLMGFPFQSAAEVGMTDESGNGNTFGNLAAALEVPPTLMEKYFAAADKILDRLFNLEQSSNVSEETRIQTRVSREQLFGLKFGTWTRPDTKITPPEGLSERDAARKIIAGFLPRAYRRPVTPTELDDLMRLYDRAAAKNAGYVGSVRMMLKAALVSPDFLFRIEQDLAAPKTKPGAGVPISDYELASRLSYFLWASMPDARLMQLAEQHKLTAPGPSPLPMRWIGTPIASNSKSSRDHTPDRAFDGDLYTSYEADSTDAAPAWVGLDFGRPRPITQIQYAGVPYYGQGSLLMGGRFQASNDPQFLQDVVDLCTVTTRPVEGLMMTQEVTAPSPYRYVRFLPKKGEPCHIAEMTFWGPDKGTALELEVRRMLTDPKAHALTDNFAARWLQFAKLPTARPSTDYFPDFGAPVRRAMYLETTTYFDHLRTDDRSVLDLLDSDYTYLNETLAKYYQIPGVTGEEIRRVPLKPEYHRGGVICMGSTLALTSATGRTSPTLRGKWILEVLFGTPPPAPPANAGIFKDEKDKAHQPKTFRERMALHATQPACASCHRMLDPLGFALENYTGAGVWRSANPTPGGGQPLDTTGVLPSGEKFEGVDGLKTILHRRQDEFVRNMTEQMYTYALGREMDYCDNGRLQETMNRLKRNDYRFSEMVMGIVSSSAFQTRRAIPPSNQQPITRKTNDGKGK